MRTATAWIVGLALVTGCAPDGSDPVRVAAASSLTDVLAEAADAFPGDEVELVFAGTPVLVAQIGAGAPLDMLISADRDNMQMLVDSGLVAGSPVVVAANELMIAVRAGNPHAIDSLSDLTEPGLLVAIGAEQVPVGRYARLALSRAGVEVEPVTLEPSVRAIVAKLLLGEVDAGIVYATDIVGADGVEGIAIPPEHNVTAEYYAATLAAASDPDAARSFLEFLTGATARDILASYGFGA